MAAIRAIVAILLFSSIAEAYGDVAHRSVVRDAFEFIIANKADTTTHYPDGATPKSDYELLLRVLAISPGPTADAELRKVAQQLGEESANTDRHADVTLTLPAWFPVNRDKTEVAGISFTLFSHFIDVRFPAVLWEHDGYSYERARQNAQCGGNAEDLLGNYLIDNVGATINTSKSAPYIAYRSPLRSNVTIADYEKHFQQDIGKIRFWPITALATFWFDSFVRSPKSQGGQPLNIVHIAPALHAAADTAQPFHAVGMSGCGHVLYENKVDGLYQANRIVDQARVKSMLVQTHLTSKISIVDLLTKNAEYAADNRFCKCSTTSCDCSFAASSEANLRELANLAIAASITVIRKGFGEWSPGRPTMTRVAPNPDSRRVIRSKSLAEIDLAPQTISVAGKFIPLSNAVFSPVNALKQVVTQIEALSRDEFRTRLSGAMADVAAATAKSSEQWDPFELQVRAQALPVPALRGGDAAAAGAASRGGPQRGDGGLQTALTVVRDPRIAFALPAPSELDSDAQWTAYARAHNNFYVTYGLYRTGVLIAWLEGNLQARRIPEAQSDAAERYAKALREKQNSLIQAYQGRPT